MTARPVRIAVQLQPQHATYELIRDRAAELEELGVDILFNWDHFFPLTGDRAAAGRPRAGPPRHRGPLGHAQPAAHPEDPDPHRRSR